MLHVVCSELKPAPAQPLPAVVARAQAKMADFKHTLGLESALSYPLSEAEKRGPAVTIVAPALRELESVAGWYSQYHSTDPRGGSVNSNLMSAWSTQLGVEAMIAFGEVNSRWSEQASDEELTAMTAAALAVNKAVRLKVCSRERSHVD